MIAVYLLRGGLCSAHVVGDPSRPDAAVIQPTRLPEEPAAFGTDPGAIWQALAGLSGWACVNVDERVAPALGRLIEARQGRPVRFLADVYHWTSPRMASAPIRA